MANMFEKNATDREAEQTMEMGERYARFTAAEQMLMDDAALIPLFWTIQATLVSPRVKGLKATAVGLTRSRWARFEE